MTAIAVVTTVASKKEARTIALALVEAKLVACAQISKIDSVYAWKGAIEGCRVPRGVGTSPETAYRATAFSSTLTEQSSIARARSQPTPVRSRSRRAAQTPIAV